MPDATSTGLAPVAFDVASPARTYNWLLGGKDNFLADRILARQVLEVAPDAHALARANRHFVVRAVRHAAWSGVRQFVDLGCGLPACPDVQAVACPIVPDARIVYVDNDPLVIRHSQAKQSNNTPGVLALGGDIRSPETILTDPRMAMIDFAQPVMMLLTAVLHFIGPDEDAPGIVSAFTSRLAPGSILAISHTVMDGSDPAALEAVTDAFHAAGSPLTPRSVAEVAAMFDGFELAPPGLADVPGVELSPADVPHAVRVVCGIGARIP
jgi:hypothetical protein